MAVFTFPKSIFLFRGVTNVSTRSVRQRTRSLLPGVYSSLDVARRSQARVVRRLHRHRGAFAEGAVEKYLFAGRFRQLVQNPPGAQVLRQRGVRNMQRTGYDAVSRTLARLAQIDQRN